MKKLLALSTIFISTLTAAQAYEIGTVCKESTQGWTRRAGACDKDGFLQGRGVASVGDLVVFGDFTKGLPNGMHHLIFAGGANLNNIASVGPGGSWISDKLREISKLNGPSYDRPVDICKINFSSGQPADNILNCGGVEAKAKSGNVRMTINNGNVIFSMGDADINGAHSRVVSGVLDIGNNNPASMKLEGTASKVELGGLTHRFGNSREKVYSFYIKGLNGIATLQPDESSNRNRNTADFIQGTFDYRGGGVGEILPNTIKQSNKPAYKASNEMLYDFSLYGNKYKAAFYENSGGLVASYLKVANGVEFDGSGFELCLNSSWVEHKDGQPNAAGAVELIFNEDRRDNRIKNLKIIPRCGKITDQTDRSYSGFFDKDGKPSPR